MSCNLHSDRGLLFRSWRLSHRSEQKEGRMGGIPRVVANEAFLPELRPLPQNKGLVMWFITYLYVLSESVWLPKRYVSGGEETILNPNVLLLLWRNLLELPPGPLDDGVAWTIRACLRKVFFDRQIVICFSIGDLFSGAGWIGARSFIYFQKCTHKCGIISYYSY